MDIDMGLVRGLLTLALFVLFCAISLWSYSKNRKPDFNEAAGLPLMEDEEAGMQSDRTLGENRE
ncbi:MAG: CcoQ/FixQ family Cbb3-type cytochrome c oxidase assembly chaperone [Pseudomonadota bacterium]